MDWYDLDKVLAAAELPEVARRLGMDVEQRGANLIARCPLSRRHAALTRAVPKRRRPTFALSLLFVPRPWICSRSCEENSGPRVPTSH